MRKTLTKKQGRKHNKKYTRKHNKPKKINIRKSKKYGGEDGYDMLRLGDRGFGYQGRPIKPKNKPISHHQNKNNSTQKSLSESKGYKLLGLSKFFGKN